MTEYLSVSALTKYIKYKFDQDPHLQSVLIKGELSNFKKHSSGHLYFNVKDKESVISAMMFKGNASKLGFEPKEGDEVLIEARVSVYERRGNYQIYVNKMQLDGIGNLYQKLELLKKKLKKEGYFNQSNKKLIPKYPKKIAVLTASTGAAIRDIHSTINNRYPLVEQIQISTLVQGTQARQDIIEKIQYADSLDVDTIIVGRGGGSIEDLWNFNEEDVVKTIFNCQTPIISAVGHETDFTLSDFVADVRAATPTQAAVIATPDQYELLQQIKQYEYTLSRYIKQYIEHQKKQLNHISSYYKFKQPSLLYDQQIQKRDELERQLNHLLNTKVEKSKHHLKLLQQSFNFKNLNQQITQEKQSIYQLHSRLSKIMSNNITNLKTVLKNKLESLNNLSPTNTMLRGYAIVNKDNEVVTSTHKLNENDQISLTMKDGSVDATVKKVRCNDE
ncbi:exodeoxyribonuclease VII large subunit [Staphylococcus epidermidis]|jgi:exodeoxyribonuclease VII, large subunit|uniref:Exodeoxyribonuclease 7 large subunit n=3 Tax=Staphylococcus epidermidis TaxID=1282 RepID=EX7L_STAES|nr:MULTISPECIES: exodeoxyribonuclease VII large subunit [Staphylococcus]Q8CP38.1 RecName: Full=Exodeoxyribonuclease 7 large subunit; AltName: Full=Exodeoxyribonuclease VII large subunit; Short=Exonuclease VII large subunit [Staphylococcus epidermidis ATCC 12228]EHQ78333.1 exodeoxyribonuclease VII, large subunit [Staphylococcus epidermidis VCU057]EHR92099.1 exodeoxyribonuclease VII, large subunit [Staphylococcus epidermidis VCU123]AAO04803.1 exodeoxyribonuclease large subunit [Staphylococcus epi